MNYGTLGRIRSAIYSSPDPSEKSKDTLFATRSVRLSFIFLPPKFLMATPMLFSLFLVFLLCPFSSVAEIYECGDFFPITTYINTTNNEIAPEKSTPYLLSLVGSYQVSKLAEKISMTVFAVDYINSISTLLPGVALQLNGANIEGVKSNTILAGIAAVRARSNVIIGGVSDAETDAVYALADRYKIMHVAPFAMSRKYQNVNNFPGLIRTTGGFGVPETEAVAGIMDHFGWERAIALVCDDDNGNALRSAFSARPKNKAITIVTFSVTGSNDNNVVSSLRHTYMNNTYIAIVCLPASVFLRVIPRMQESNLFDSKFAYILCDDVTTALENDPNFFGEHDSLLSGSVALAPKGLGRNEFYQEMHNRWMISDPSRYPGERPPRVNSWLAFESVYMIAKALDNIINAGANSSSITSTQLRESMGSLDYEGVTGKVKFSSGSTIDRLALWDVFNYHDRNLIYKYSLSHEQPFVPYDIIPGNFTFFGGRTDIPIDWTRKLEANLTATEAPTVAPLGRVIRGYDLGVSSGFGVVIVICMLLGVFSAIVLYFKVDRFKALGVPFSATVILGCFVMFGAAITLVPKPADHLCVIFPWLLGVGYNITYSCMFIKMWSFFWGYRRGTNAEEVSTKKLAIVVVASIIAEIYKVVQILWTTLDAPRVLQKKNTDETYDLRCQSKSNTFWIIFLSYKGAWTMCGAVMARMTRKKVEPENQVFKSISNAIYNSTILFILGIPAGVGLSMVHGGRIIIEVVLVLVCAVFTLAILFFDVWYNIVGQASKAIEMAAKKSSPANSNSPHNSQNSHNSYHSQVRNSQNSHNSHNSQNPPSPHNSQKNSHKSNSANPPDNSQNSSINYSGNSSAC